MHSWDDLTPYRGTIFSGQWPTIPELFEITHTKFPDRPCFTEFSPDRRTYTFDEVSSYLATISSYLQQQGIQPGSNVALYGKNSPEWAIAYLAVQFAGAVIVPLDAQLSPTRAAELASFAQCSGLIASKETLSEVKENMSASPQVTLCLDPDASGYLLSVEVSQQLPKVPRSEDDLAAILFTSGTTGNEKGVMLTHKNIMTDVYQACDPAYMTASEEDVFYALLPLHHSYCMTAVFLEQIKHGGELVCARTIAIKRIIQDMQQAQVSIFMGIPMIYNKMLAGLMKEVRVRGRILYFTVRILMGVNGFLKKHLGINPGRSRWFKQLLEGIGFYHNRLCICGGGPLPAKTFRQFQQLGLDFVQGYGLTETAPIVTLNPKDHFKVRSVGKVFPFVDIKIENPDMFGVGEILLKGPNITQGYYRDSEHTKELFTTDGYLRTGDLGVLDRERYLYLRGRKKNLIVTSGGKNVYPEEIEDAFQLYQTIEQIMVRGYIKNKSQGAEEIEALVYPSSEAFGESISDKAYVERTIWEAIREVNQHLPSYKKITRLTLLEAPMDMTTTKKIQRNKVLAKLDSIRGRASSMS